MKFYCINTHCYNEADPEHNGVIGHSILEWYCCYGCKIEDELRQKAGLNENNTWQTQTYLDGDSGELKIK
jgi:hypothetical protein